MFVIFTYNLIGIWMLIASILITIAACKLSGTTSEAAPMLAFGIPAVLLDLFYRLCKRRGHWIQPTKGGMFMHVPIWIYGCFSIVVGLWCIAHEFVPSK